MTEHLTYCCIFLCLNPVACRGCLKSGGKTSFLEENAFFSHLDKTNFIYAPYPSQNSDDLFSHLQKNLFRHMFCDFNKHCSIIGCPRLHGHPGPSHPPPPSARLCLNPIQKVLSALKPPKQDNRLVKSPRNGNAKVPSHTQSEKRKALTAKISLRREQLK